MKITLQSLPEICALGAVAIALLGLLGYVPGLGMLGSIRDDYIPMAPSTALSFILLGFILVMVNIKQLSGGSVIVPLIGAVLVSLFGVLAVAGFFSGMDLNFEDAIVPAIGNLNGIPIARMSPGYGCCIFPLRECCIASHAAA